MVSKQSLYCHQWLQENQESLTTRLCTICAMYRLLIDVVVLDIWLLPVSLECWCAAFFQFGVCSEIVTICVMFVIYDLVLF